MFKSRTHDLFDWRTPCPAYRAAGAITREVALEFQPDRPESIGRTRSPETAQDCNHALDAASVRRVQPIVLRPP